MDARIAMTPEMPESFAELSCHGCGYDLRAHAAEENCPECGLPVAESVRFAALPRRPAWRDSDPRWRRRIVAGVWILALMPLMDLLTAFEWSASIAVPNVFNYPGALRLDETLLCSFALFESVAFCMGAVLLFARERGRRPGRLDWSRRWGVVCSYVVLLLVAANVLFISALVLSGIAAIFQSMAVKYQPPVTPLFVELSTMYLRYGPYPKAPSGGVLIGFSSVVMLLACIPLYDALRSASAKRLAWVLVVPLALFALIHIAQVVHYFRNATSASVPDLYRYAVFFWPQPLVWLLAGRETYYLLSTSRPSTAVLLVEGAKWSIVFVIAVWLSFAEITALMKLWATRLDNSPDRSLRSL